MAEINDCKVSKSQTRMAKCEKVDISKDFIDEIESEDLDNAADEDFQLHFQQTAEKKED